MSGKSVIFDENINKEDCIEKIYWEVNQLGTSSE